MWGILIEGVYHFVFWQISVCLHVLAQDWSRPKSNKRVNKYIFCFFVSTHWCQIENLGLEFECVLSWRKNGTKQKWHIQMRNSNIFKSCCHVKYPFNTHYRYEYIPINSDINETPWIITIKLWRIHVSMLFTCVECSQKMKELLLFDGLKSGKLRNPNNSDLLGKISYVWGITVLQKLFSLASSIKFWINVTMFNFLLHFYKVYHNLLM